MEDKYEIIFNKIFESINVPKIIRIMRRLNWKWNIRGELQYPNANEIYLMCHDLFEDSLQDFKKYGKTASSTSGGFKVTFYENQDITLDFIIESSTYDFELNSIG